MTHRYIFVEILDEAIRNLDNSTFGHYLFRKSGVEILSALQERENAVNVPAQRRGLFKVLEDELRLRNYSHKTLKAYRSCIRTFVQYFSPKHPRDISNAEIRSFLLDLLENREWEASSINQMFNALRFLYVELYKMPFVIENIPRPKKERKLPSVLSQEEVLKILSRVNNAKHKTILMLIYSAGLRVGESVRLEVGDIDGTRKLIHLHGAKGKKDRYTILSDAALEMLREYYKEYKPRTYLFEGQGDRSHLAE